MLIVLNIKKIYRRECGRLHLLQCYYAKINALWLCLQSCGAYVASMTMQESLVLLLGKACDCKSRMYLSFIVIADAREHEKNLEVSMTELRCTDIGFYKIVINIEE